LDELSFDLSIRKEKLVFAEEDRFLGEALPEEFSPHPGHSTAW
jgi:hypothetical protein